MDRFYEKLKHIDCNSVVLYIQGNSEADLQRKSKDIHRNLEKNHLADRLRIT